MIPFVSFDFTQNPWDVDVSSIIKFEEYPDGLVDSFINAQMQMIGYDTTNYIQAMQSILIAIAMVILKVVYICILQLKICIYKDNEDYKES